MSRALIEKGPQGREAAETLVHLFKIQGRFHDARQLVRSAWEHYPDAIGVLKELAQIDSLNPYPVARARETLQRAEQSAPDDDRVWLGFANLALRMNDLKEAERWLVRCEERRPHDPAVGRSRLRLALATEDAAAILTCLRGLPSDTLEPDEVFRLRVWFAERSGDASSEKKALLDLLQVEPDDSRALERLSELEFRAGETASAGRLRARKAELDRAKVEYEEVLFLPDAQAQAERLACLAETLERNLEARIL
jgi:predicted Zn-dependent protease